MKKYIFTKSCANPFIPAGTIVDVTGNNMPSKFLLECDGDVLLSDQYPELFAMIGHQYGPAPVSGTFCLPDFSTTSIICACGHVKKFHTRHSVDDTNFSPTECLVCKLEKESIQCKAFADDNLNWLVKNR